MGLNVEKLNFSYGDVRILRDVSFSVNEPGLVGIIGPNGSGKSTLVKNILDLLQPGFFVSAGGQTLIFRLRDYLFHELSRQ